MTGLVATIFRLNYFKWLCVDPRNICFITEQPHQRCMFWLINHEKNSLWFRISSGEWTSCWLIFDDFIKNFEVTKVRQNHLLKAKNSISEFGDMCVFGNACISRRVSFEEGRYFIKVRIIFSIWRTGVQVVSNLQIQDMEVFGLFWVIFSHFWHPKNWGKNMKNYVYRMFTLYGKFGIKACLFRDL